MMTIIYLDCTRLTFGKDVAKVVHDGKQAVRADRNHPSIILWSLGNEITEQRNDVIPGEYDRFERRGRRLLAIAREEVPTRPCTTANNGRESWNRPETQFVDVYGFNYDPDRIAAYHRLHPDKPMVSTETARLVAEVSPHDAFNGWLSALVRRTAKCHNDAFCAIHESVTFGIICL